MGNSPGFASEAWPLIETYWEREDCINMAINLQKNLVKESHRGFFTGCFLCSSMYLGAGMGTKGIYRTFKK